MNTFKPFENDSQSTTVGPGNGVTFENGKESITVYGDYEIDKTTTPKEIDDLIEMLENIKKELIQNNVKKLKN